MNNSEELPYISLDLGGQEFKATPENAHFYHFAGQSILENGDVIDNNSRSHVFLITGELEGEVQRGTYIFNPETVQALGTMMLEGGFHCDINRRHIPACDETAYQTWISQQLEEAPDFLPDGWE